MPDGGTRPVKTSGVYAIRSLDGECLYVGSAINIRVRWIAHVRHLRGGFHHSRALQRYWNKHGPHSLVFEIISETDAHRTEEARAIAELAPLFNCLRPDVPQGPMRHAPESINRMKASHAGRRLPPETYEKAIATRRAAFPDGIIRLTPEHIAKARAGRKSYDFSASTRALMRAAKIGKPLAPDHAAKISDSLKGRVFSVGHRKKLRGVALRRWHSSPPNQLSLL